MVIANFLSIFLFVQVVFGENTNLASNTNNTNTGQNIATNNANINQGNPVDSGGSAITGDTNVPGANINQAKHAESGDGAVTGDTNVPGANKEQSLTMVSGTPLTDIEQDTIFEEAAYLDVNAVKVQILDKITGEVTVFPIKVASETLAFKRLRVSVHRCFKTPDHAKLEYIALVEIWEIKLGGNAEKIYSGWMFSGHTVNVLEHPIYDVRVVN